jgi:hypothetical protein
MMPIFGTLIATASSSSHSRNDDRDDQDVPLGRSSSGTKATDAPLPTITTPLPSSSSSSSSRHMTTRSTTTAADGTERKQRRSYRRIIGSLKVCVPCCFRHLTIYFRYLTIDLNIRTRRHQKMKMNVSLFMPVCVILVVVEPQHYREQNPESAHYVLRHALRNR